MFYSSGRLFWCVSCAVRFLFRAAIDAIGKRLARASFAFRCFRRLERVVGRESACVACVEAPPASSELRVLVRLAFSVLRSLGVADIS